MDADEGPDEGLRPPWRVRSDELDERIAELLAKATASSPSRVAVVAVGGYGRRELSPGSDVDVVLLHDGAPDVGELAESLWYPLWDEGLTLGHAVRTTREALRLAGEDLATATSLLSTRHVAGDDALSLELALSARERWERRARRNLSELARSVRQRHARAGEVAFLLEPDVKEGRGGLRDVHAVRWAQIARPVMLEGDDVAFDAAYEVVLRIRDGLHRVTGRRGDRLALEEQDAVAEAVGEADADALVRALAGAARTIAWRSDEVWERVEASLEGPVGRLARRDRPCGPGVVLRDGQVHALGDPDPTVVLDVAVAAARHGARIERATLSRLAGRRPDSPFPWTPARRDAFVELLAAGRATIPVVESLDQYGLWAWILPEWDHVRSLPQRNAYHAFTVDRHLCEAVANAAALTGGVHRPDLLLMGALLHDIGKGRPGDHTAAGIPVAEEVARRLGFDEADVAVVADLVRHHLLLADVATRRDVEEDATLRTVAGAVGSIGTLELLAALTEADSLATGPSAWSTWKAGLVDRLVERVSAKLGGASREGAGGDAVERTPDGSDAFPNTSQLALAARGHLALVPEATALTVVAPDRRGLFSTVAGGLALAGLDVLAAQVHTEDGMAIERFEVRSRVAPAIDWERAVRQIEAALEGRVAIAARLAERARRYDRRAPGVEDRSVTVRIDPDASDRATVVEVLAPDALGLLHRLTRAVAELDLDIRTARVQTLADRAVDVFYLVGPGGGKVTDAARLGEIEVALRHAVDA